MKMSFSEHFVLEKRLKVMLSNKQIQYQKKVIRLDESLNIKGKYHYS